jgi:hypothetical protein
LSQRPLLPPSTSQPIQTTGEPVIASAPGKVEQIQNAFRALNEGSDLIIMSRSHQQVVGNVESLHDSQQSLSVADCESQIPPENCSADRLIQRDGRNDSTSEALERSAGSHQTRLATRKEARNAATRALLNNDYGGWNDLNLGSLGRTDRGEEELEL